MILILSSGGNALHKESIATMIKNKGTWLGSAIPMPLFIIIYQTRPTQSVAPYLGTVLSHY